jgi:hypothetical protein
MRRERRRKWGKGEERKWKGEREFIRNDAPG